VLPRVVALPSGQRRTGSSYLGYGVSHRQIADTVCPGSEEHDQVAFNRALVSDMRAGRIASPGRLLVEVCAEQSTLKPSSAKAAAQPEHRRRVLNLSLDGNGSMPITEMQQSASITPSLVGALRQLRLPGIRPPAHHAPRPERCKHNNVERHESTIDYNYNAHGHYRIC